MKKIILLIAAVFTFSYANSQCSSWEKYTVSNGGLPTGYNSIEMIKTNPYTSEKFAFTYSSVLKYNDTLNAWDLLSASVEATDVEFDANGNMYIGTMLSGIYVYDGTNLLPWANNDSLYMGNSTTINDMCFDSEGGFWVAVGYGAKTTSMIQRYYNGNIESYNITNTAVLQNNDAELIQADKFGNVFLFNYSFSGLVQYNVYSQNWNTVTTFGLYTLDYVNEMIIDDKGFLNITFLDNGQFLPHLFKFDNVNWTEIDLATIVGASINSIENIQIFRDNLWFNTGNKVYQVSPSGVYLYDGQTPSGDLFGSLLNDINFDIGGYLFIANPDTGIFKVNLSSSLTAIAVTDLIPLTSSFVEIELYSNTINSVFGQDSLLGYMAPSGSAFELTGLYPDTFYISTSILTGTIYEGVLVNSYYALNDTVYNWQDATLIDLNFCVDDTVTINMYKMPTMIPGFGFVSGNISYGLSGGSKAIGEPVPGAEILIEQEPDDEPVAYATSNSNGDYSFPALQENMDFHLIVDIPGIPQIQTYNIQFTSANFSIANLDFIVDTTGIYIDTTVSIMSNNTELFKFNVYPNPSISDFNIDYKIIKDSYVEIKLVDSKSSVIKEISLSNKSAGDYTFEINDLEKGIYFIQMRIDNTMYVRKLIITN